MSFTEHQYRRHAVGRLPLGAVHDAFDPRETLAFCLGEDAHRVVGFLEGLEFALARIELVDVVGKVVRRGGRIANSGTHRGMHGQILVQSGRITHCRGPPLRRDARDEGTRCSHRARHASSSCSQSIPVTLNSRESSRQSYLWNSIALFSSCGCSSVTRRRNRVIVCLVAADVRH
jgi:hypothetical protein